MVAFLTRHNVDEQTEHWPENGTLYASDGEEKAANITARYVH
jgi:hypothetical protein